MSVPDITSSGQYRARTSRSRNSAKSIIGYVSTGHRRASAWAEKGPSELSNRKKDRKSHSEHAKGGRSYPARPILFYVPDLLRAVQSRSGPDISEQMWETIWARLPTHVTVALLSMPRTEVSCAGNRERKKRRGSRRWIVAKEKNTRV
eukprot:2737029-Rhodomonas_salina.1